MKSNTYTLMLYLSALLAIVVGCGNDAPNVLFDGGTDTDTDSDTDGDSDGDGDSDSDSDGDSDSDTDSECGDLSLVFDTQTPTVILLIDQSGSMSESFDSGTRWSVLGDTLFDSTNGIVKNLEAEIRFGIMLYTSNGGDAGGTCPTITEEAPSLNNYTAIDNVYSSNSPSGDTPTGESIDETVTALLADTHPDDKVIVLATDGEPDTCAVPNPQNGQPESVAAAEDAFQAGIRTYIISVGDAVSLGHMQDMANAGQGVQPGDPDADYYQAMNQAALENAFDEIINGIRSCVLALNGSVVSGLENQCTVEVDGSPVTYNDPNGWQLNSPSEMELLGTSCDAIQQGEVEIEVSCPCDAVVID